MSDSRPDRVIAHGRFLRLIDRNGWEFAERAASSAVVTIVAITDEQTLLLVEQFRIPLGRAVVELPAGLAGDSAEHRDEPAISAARRELLEETGYEAAEWTRLAEAPSSAGLTNECITFFLARRLRRVTQALGEGGEELTLHEVPLSELDAWLDQARARGCAVDAKIYSGLHLARRVIAAER